MDNGFKALLGGVLLAALVFGLLTVMPAVSMLTNASGTAISSPQPVIASLPPSPAPAKLSAPAADAKESPEPDEPAKEYVFLQEEEQLPPKRWLYANGNVMLRKEPSGEPFIPLSASFAPLTIHSGTRLWPVRTEAEWVMVQSPGKTLGWVHKDEVFTDSSGQSGAYYDRAAPRRPWLQ